MAFTITLKQCLSENNRVTKFFNNTVYEITGTLKEQSSIIDPVIVAQISLADIKKYNYAVIPAFGRNYFIKNVVSISNSLVEFQMHVDVLSTYANEIKSNQAIIRKQQYSFNKYLNDGTFRTYQNPRIVTKNFPAGFNTQEFVLAVAGS